jgi:hypothetical protein
MEAAIGSISAVVEGESLDSPFDFVSFSISPVAFFVASSSFALSANDLFPKIVHDDDDDDDTTSFDSSCRSDGDVTSSIVCCSTASPDMPRE